MKCCRVIVLIVVCLALVTAEPRKTRGGSSRGSGKTSRGSSRRQPQPQPAPPAPSQTLSHTGLASLSYPGYNSPPARKPQPSAPDISQNRNQPAAGWNVNRDTAVKKEVSGVQQSNPSYPAGAGLPGGAQGSASHSYPASSGLSGSSGGTAGHSYPASPGSSGNSPQHTYPAASGASGASPQHTYPAAAGASGPGQQHSYPASNGLSGSGPVQARPQNNAPPPYNANAPPPYSPNSNVQGPPPAYSAGHPHGGVPGYGAPPPYGAMQPGYGGHGYGAPQGGYGAPNQGYGGGFGGMGGFGGGYGNNIGGYYGKPKSSFLSGNKFGLILAGLAVWNLARSGQKTTNNYYYNNNSNTGGKMDPANPDTPDPILGELINCTLTMTSLNDSDVVLIPCVIATSFAPNVKLDGNSNTPAFVPDSMSQLNCTITVITKNGTEVKTNIPCETLSNLAPKDAMAGNDTMISDAPSINCTSGPMNSSLTETSVCTGSVLTDPDPSLEVIPLSKPTTDPTTAATMESTSTTTTDPNSSNSEISTLSSTESSPISTSTTVVNTSTTEKPTEDTTTQAE